MTISQRKKLRVVQELSRLVPEFSNNTLEVNKLLVLLSSTTQVVLPARIQYRYLQELQITLNLQKSYRTQVTLNNLAKTELLWSIENLRKLNGRSLRLQ